MAVCTSCNREFGFADVRGGICRDCRAKAEAASIESAYRKIENGIVSPEDLNDPALARIIITTGSEIPGRRIDSIVDVVGAETALGLSIFKDIANNFRDFFGGRSKTVQSAVRDARTVCMIELRREAVRLNADAIIAIKIDFSELSMAGGGGILFVAATGTAVKLAD
ncbi:YbjQ family protein [Neorhizobium galegae]|uniref:YbjQ family protein n=1 Tax=Neorhizobium galegae TaxID=399 RepID=UPI0021066793|nr:heavy metal-binding domain-containing protein [Neorhizobium galegae]MCQ1835590.1 YbjQ family protein [Neorhizobium galegae]UIY28808.1 YbjQ family protein [Neorhizobium galegae]